MMKSVCLLCIWFIGTIYAPKLLAHGPIHEKIDSLSSLLESYPDSISLYIERGIYYKIDEDWERAEADFLHVLSIENTSYTLYFELADLYYHKRDFKRANQYIKQYLAHYPSHANAHKLSGKIWMNLDLREEAIASFNKALLLKKEVAKVDDYLDLANAYQRDYPKKAFQTLEKGIDKFGNLMVLQTQLMSLLVEHGWYEKALKIVDEILLTANRKEHWLLTKASIYELDNQCVLAKQTYQNCLSEIAGLKQKTKETELVKRIHQQAITALKYL